MKLTAQEILWRFKNGLITIFNARWMLMDYYSASKVDRLLLEAMRFRP